MRFYPSRVAAWANYSLRGGAASAKNVVASCLYYSGSQRVLAPYTRGVGVIFMLHGVFPEADEQRSFAPNRIGDITPKFLNSVLDQVHDAGFDVISLDEAMRRLSTNSC